MVLVLGFLRKDIAMGLLAPLQLTVKQLVISSVILAMFFPCVATFMVILKELGAKKLIQGTIIMLFASILTGLILNLVL